MAAFQSDWPLQIVLLVALVVLFLHCLNKCVAAAIDEDRRVIADGLRMFAKSARTEHFELMPEHIDDLADNIEGFDQWR